MALNAHLKTLASGIAVAARAHGNGSPQAEQARLAYDVHRAAEEIRQARADHGELTPELRAVVLAALEGEEGSR